ncbi:MAG: TIGR04283 family arsenosugar biosynthesis glycosyltransferase [Persicimonas sp.]
MSATISVITPTLNEADRLRARADEIAAQTGPREWIVVDADSSDQTARVAESLGARVLSARRGRGPQMNAGAEAARGDILLFLHADTRLPQGAFAAIRQAIDRHGAVGGNFALRFEGDLFFSGILTLQAYLRQKWTGVYFGDSAIFVRRDVFDEIGGFPDQPIMEDYEFSRKLEASGATRRLSPPVWTSDRRFKDRKLRTLLTWGLIHLLYRLGVPAERLARLYAHAR